MHNQAQEKRRLVKDRQPSQSPTDSTISFRLVAEYGAKLERAAKAAKVTPHQMARQLLVAALECPQREELVTDLYELNGNLEFLLAEVRELRRELAHLKVGFAASIELLLVNVAGVAPETAQETIDSLFGEEV